MSYKEFLNKFLNLVRSSSSSIKNAKELSYGEPGILQTILNYEKEEKKSITSGMIENSKTYKWKSIYSY